MMAGRGCGDAGGGGAVGGSAFGAVAVPGGWRSNCGHLITPKQKTEKFNFCDNATDDELFLAQKRLGVIRNKCRDCRRVAGGLPAVPGRVGRRRAVVGASSGGRRGGRRAGAGVVGRCGFWGW